MALAFAPLAVLLNSQFFLPITNGFMERSPRLLSISKRPSLREDTRRSHWLRQYLIACPHALFGITLGVCSRSYAEKASNISWLRSSRILYRYCGLAVF